MLKLDKALLNLKADADGLFTRNRCPTTDNTIDVFGMVKGSPKVTFTETESKGWSIILLLCLAIGSATFLTAIKICDIQTYKELMIATISGVLGVIVGRQTGK